MSIKAQRETVAKRCQGLTLGVLLAPFFGRERVRTKTSKVFLL